MKPSLLILAAAAACGTTSAAPSPDAPGPLPDAPPGNLDSVVLGPAPGWPSSVAVRSVPATFRTSITDVQVEPAGRVWLLRNEISQPSEFPGSPVLERYAADGPLEKRITFPAHAQVTSFVIHPSGELTVFVMRDDDGDTLSYGLEILRLSHDGDILADVTFTDTPGPRENLYYDDSGVRVLPVIPFTLTWTSHVVALPDGEGMFVLAEWSYGFKLYRLDQSFGTLWHHQVMPGNVGTVFQGSPSLLARDDDGSVYVATEIFQDDVHIYGDHFGRPALTPHGLYDTLVQRFDADGTFSGARLFGGPAIDHASAMTVHGGNVLLAGAARISKLTLPNRTMELDVLLERAPLDGAAPEDYRTIDLSRDDFVWTLAEAPGGGLVLGGRTDYVKVDTNSEVENGKGLFLTLSSDLTQESTLELVGPRDVQVNTLRLRSDGSYVFAGTRDGPLTHTDPSMTNNDGVWGVLKPVP